MGIQNGNKEGMEWRFVHCLLMVLVSEMSVAESKSVYVQACRSLEPAEEKKITITCTSVHKFNGTMRSVLIKIISGVTYVSLHVPGPERTFCALYTTFCKLHSQAYILYCIWQFLHIKL